MHESSMKEHLEKYLEKIREFLFDVYIVFKKDKPRVSIAFSRERGIVELQNLSINGQIMDTCDTRKVTDAGGMLVVSHPPRWVELVSLEGYVKTQLIVTEKSGNFVLISKPEKENVDRVKNATET